MKSAAQAHSATFNGVMINTYHANAGEGIPRHDHEYSHLTICHAGRIAVRKEGIYKELDKTSTPVNLRAGEWHEIEAIEDGTVFENIFIAP